MIVSFSWPFFTVVSLCLKNKTRLIKQTYFYLTGPQEDELTPHQRMGTVGRQQTGRSSQPGHVRCRENRTETATLHWGVVASVAPHSPETEATVLLPFRCVARGRWWSCHTFHTQWYVKCTFPPISFVPCLCSFSFPFFHVNNFYVANYQFLNAVSYTHLTLPTILLV